MTPEEILKQFIDKMASLEDDNDIGTMMKAKDEAIEAIKAYAREMCDKQRESCVEAWRVIPIGKGSLEKVAIFTAPYPKELL